MQEYTTNFSLQTFPTLDLVPFILPNLRTPLWGFWQPFWQLFYNIDSRYYYKKFPFPKCILTFICHLVLQLEPLLSSSSFKHQPLIAIPYFELLLLLYQVIGATNFFNNQPNWHTPKLLDGLNYASKCEDNERKRSWGAPWLAAFWG